MSFDHADGDDDPPSREFVPTGLLVDPSDSSSEDSDADLWSAVPTLPEIPELATLPTNQDQDQNQAKDQRKGLEEDWDAAQEMDPQAEEGEYVRFISQMRGKDLESVRREIDDEIRTLNQQRKVAMRDSEDITQQMISQIMVREIQIVIRSPALFRFKGARKKGTLMPMLGGGRERS